MSIIIVASLIFAIAILAVAAANADALPTSNNAVIVHYSDKISFGAAAPAGDTADAAISRLIAGQSQRAHLGIETPKHFIAPIFQKWSQPLTDGRSKKAFRRKAGRLDD